ncbi:MAG: hypothetical protein QM749_07365 [Aquabacterium sp.]
MKLSAISGAMLAVFGIASAHAQTYLFTDLGHANGVASAAAGINNAGQVVGLYSDSSNLNHAVTWINGQATDLGSASANWGWGGFTNPWGVSGSAISINDAGQIAWTSTNASNASQATLWDKGVTTNLGTLGGTQSDARGINQAGQVVGQAQKHQRRLAGRGLEQRTTHGAGDAGRHVRLASQRSQQCRPGCRDRREAVG